MKSATEWPKKTIYWIEDRTLYASIPFTWELLKVSDQLRQTSLEWDQVVVGGPAVELVPGMFNTLPYVTVLTWRLKNRWLKA